MNRHLIRALTRLYPAWWRRRYADEFNALLAEGEGGMRDIANVVWSAVRERTLLGGRWELNRSQHAQGYLALSFLPALAGGINLVMTVDDTQLVEAMGSHTGMSVAWNLLAGAAVLCGIGVLFVVVSLYKSMLFHAWKARRRATFALLGVPFLSGGVLVLWTVCVLAYSGGRWAASPWAILGRVGAPPFWPSLNERWVCGIISTVLCVVVAAASAISVHQAIRMSDSELSNGQTLPKRRALANLVEPLVVVCTIVMFLSVLAWGLALQQSAPCLFQRHIGLLDGTAGSSWVISLGLFGLAVAICIRANQSLESAHMRESL